MAKVGCLCGASLSDVICPSDAIVYIYKQEELDHALRHKENISLWEFYENTMSNHLYWYCNNCKRVYKFPCGAEAKPIAIYKRENSEEKFNREKLMQIVVLSDVAIDDVTEDDSETLLKDFLKNRKQEELYYLDDKKQCIYVLAKENYQTLARDVKEK